MAGYKFWYISTPGAKTEYIWIIAESEEQANHYFSNHGYDQFYDYDLEPCEYLPEHNFLNYHHAGQIYGGDALL